MFKEVTFGKMFLRWCEKYLSKRNLIKQTCSLRVNVFYYEHWAGKHYFYVNLDVQLSSFWSFIKNANINLNKAEVNAVV